MLTFCFCHQVEMTFQVNQQHYCPCSTPLPPQGTQKAKSAFCWIGAAPLSQWTLVHNTFYFILCEGRNTTTPLLGFVNGLSVPNADLVISEVLCLDFGWYKCTFHQRKCFFKDTRGIHFLRKDTVGSVLFLDTFMLKSMPRIQESTWNH